MNKTLYVKIIESGLSFFLFFFLVLYFIFDLFSISPFLELRVRVRTMISHISHS